MIFSDLFLNPTYFWIGAAMIAVPIIIHLINRMRYKRLRWAAMEFLLKSQKRNRRRLIIEQLILLALRCFLVLLAGILVARFIGNIGNKAVSEKDVEHFVVIDDTLSMTDRFLDEGTKRETNSFEVAKQGVLDIAAEAQKNNSQQFFRVVLLSEIRGDKFGPPLFDEKLNDKSLGKLKEKLNETQPSLMHVKPIKAIQWAKKQTTSADRQRILHFVTDLRDNDWSGPEVENLNNELAEFSKNNKALFYDVAYRFRTQQQAVAPASDNICISDLRPESRFTAPSQLVQFSATIQNYSLSKKNVFFHVKVDGEERDEVSAPVDVPPGEFHHTFGLVFNKERYSLVSATLEDKTGPVEDKTRVCAIQVKPEVPILMIDGSDDESNKQPDPGPHKDSWYLEELYKLARGYKVVVKAPEDLKKINLSPVDYPCLYLLDVPNLSDESLKKVEDYVEQGGRVAIFLGKHVQASFYNTKLWNNGNGIFPVPLDLQPKSIDQLEHDKRIDERQYQVYLRDEGHPVLHDIADQEHRWLLKKLVIDTYWPAKPHTEWRADPSKVHELMTLPKHGNLELFDAAIKAIREKLKSQDPKNAPFRGTLDYYEAKLGQASDDSFNAVSSTLDLLLNERGNNAAQKLVDLGPFWEMPENAELRTQAADLRDAMRYGDPLMISKSFGKGQTIVFMTTAGAHWHDWGTKSPAIHTYPLVMLNLQKYLTGVTTDSSRTVGTPWEYVVDADSVPGKDTRAAISFQAAPHGVFDRTKIDKAEVREKDLDTVEGVVEDNGKKIRYTFADTRLPGIYHVVIKGKPKPEKPGEKVAPAYDEVFVYNVDADNESKLKRASRDAIERNPSGQTREQVALITPGTNLTDLLAPKQQDWSEAPWLYLIILLVLIIEQALAVHLSFHMKGSEGQTPGAGGGERTPVPAAEAA